MFYLVEEKLHKLEVAIFSNKSDGNQSARQTFFSYYSQNMKHYFWCILKLKNLLFNAWRRGNSLKASKMFGEGLMLASIYIEVSESYKWTDSV